MKKQTVALVLAVALVIGCSMGGTMAWLTSQSDKVTNVFTTSDIDITLDESALNKDGLTLNKEAKRVTSNYNYKMIPGWTIEKDPVVTVKAGSEPCWLFVEVTESIDPKLDAYISYDVILDDNITGDIDGYADNGWTAGKENDDIPSNVYYKKIVNVDDVSAKLANDVSFNIIGYNYGTTETPSYDANKVLVKDTVTKEMMNALEADDATQPTLTFTAYATQLYKDNDTEFSAAEAWQKVKPEEGTGGTTN